MFSIENEMFSVSLCKNKVSVYIPHVVETYLATEEFWESRAVTVHRYWCSCPVCFPGFRTPPLIWTPQQRTVQSPDVGEADLTLSPACPPSLESWGRQ